ncbi:unnamed protein product [Lampetra planeri]
MLPTSVLAAERSRDESLAVAANINYGAPCGVARTWLKRLCVAGSTDGRAEQTSIVQRSGRHRYPDIHHRRQQIREQQLTELSDAWHRMSTDASVSPELFQKLPKSQTHSSALVCSVVPF